MTESRGRPGSAGQRPTGGDKAVATQKKQYFRRKKVCRFCVERIDDINYKDVKLLHVLVIDVVNSLDAETAHFFAAEILLLLSGDGFIAARRPLPGASGSSSGF